MNSLPQALLDFVRAECPSDVLAVMPQAECLVTALADLPTVRVHHIWGDDLLQRLDAAGSTAMAVVADRLESMTAAQGRALLAALRDRYSQCCAVMVREPWASSADWDRAAFASLGFRTLQGAEAAGHRLYVYALKDYKHTPDWLNARFWANPERWDKERW